jgi:hypothetical protein
MSSGELAYLIMVIAGTLLFMGTLAWVSCHNSVRKDATSRRRQIDQDHGQAVGRKLDSKV